MLEYNFNELDNDYITCWCKYLLTGDMGLVMQDLTRLAELGQVNAISAFYRYNKMGVNKLIDKNFNSLSDTYHKLAIKARIGSTDPYQIETQKDLLRYVDEEHYVHGFRSGHYELTDRAVDARKKIYNLDFIDNYYKAKDRAFEIGTRTNDVVVIESANEIYVELSNKIGIEDTSRKMAKGVAKINKAICSTIAKEIKDSKKKDSNYDILNNPALAFTLVRAVLLFNEDHKLKPLAIKVLKDLAKREYSKEFKIGRPTSKI